MPFSDILYELAHVTARADDDTLAMLARIKDYMFNSDDNMPPPPSNRLHLYLLQYTTACTGYANLSLQPVSMN